MEKIEVRRKHIPGVLVEQFENVEPEELNNLRMQAGLFVSERHFSDEEITKISEDKKTPLTEIEFKDGTKLIRMNFPSGSIMELYKNTNGNDRYRISYDAGAKTARTQRSSHA